MKNLYNKSLGNYIMNFNKYIIKWHWKMDCVQFYRNRRKIMIYLDILTKEKLLNIFFRP